MTISSDIQARLDHFHILSEIAREITLPLFAEPKGVVNKADSQAYDPVTQADIDAEAALRKSIRETSTFLRWIQNTLDVQIQKKSELGSSAQTTPKTI